MLADIIAWEGHITYVVFKMAQNAYHQLIRENYQRNPNWGAFY